MSVILGINAFHADSAACIVIDGELKSAIAEERFGKREKHCPRCFPENAIRRVLQEFGVTLKDVTHVAIVRNPKANYWQKLEYVLKLPIPSFFAVMEHLRRRRHTSNMINHLADICGINAGGVNFERTNVEHHLAHIASSYYLSPFDSLTAAFSYDASGDFPHAYKTLACRRQDRARQ